MSEEIKKENAEAAASDTTEKKDSKGTWLNRVISAITGVVIGILSVFGVNQAQINEIKTDVASVQDNTKQLIEFIQNRRIWQSSSLC